MLCRPAPPGRANRRLHLKRSLLLLSGQRGRPYPEKERAQKLGEIEKLTGRGETLKDAIKKAGISEQTYYQWKKAAGQAPQSGELKDLVKLEEENTRLKKLLADRLRKENAELKKKLGLVFETVLECIWQSLLRPHA